MCTLPVAGLATLRARARVCAYACGRLCTCISACTGAAAAGGERALPAIHNPFRQGSHAIRCGHMPGIHGWRAADDTDEQLVVVAARFLVVRHHMHNASYTYLYIATYLHNLCIKPASDLHSASSSWLPKGKPITLT